MRKFYNSLLLLTLVVLGINSAAFAAKVSTIQEGIWEDPTIWSTGEVPGEQDEVTLLHSVTAENARVIGSMGSIRVMPGVKFVTNSGIDVYGVFQIDGTVEIGMELEHYGRTIVNGSLTVQGDIEVRTGWFSNNGEANTQQDVKVHAGGMFEQNGLSRVKGDLNNFGNTYGGEGLFRVCGDANHDGVVEGVVYLCLECEGSYTDNGAGTFILSCTPFPVIFSEFSGLLTKEGVKLTWVTETENNSDRFVIERAVQSVTESCTLGVCSKSTDFYPIGEIPAAGQSSTHKGYTFTDENPGAGINFYRIKVVDLDGGHDYSPTIAVSSTEFTSNLEVFPNPNNDILHIRVLAADNAKSEIILYDIQGRKIWDKPLQAEVGTAVIVELQATRYAAGTYIVEFRNGNKSLTKKVIFFK